MAALGWCAVPLPARQTGEPATSADASESESIEQASRQLATARRLSNAGHYADAVPLARQAAQTVEAKLGPDSPRTASFLNELASILGLAGQRDQALPLLQRALAIREKALGPDHPEVAVSLHNLGAAYRGMGRYHEALAVNERALAIREKSYGPDDPRVAVSLSNLALTFDALGQYDRALPLHERSLAIREKASGPAHPDVAVGLSNLAGTLDSLGQYDRALPLYQRALAIREKALGPDHPEVARSLNNLAHAFNAIGQYNRALPLHERALAIREKALGPDHPDLAHSLNNLAYTYSKLGQLGKALPLDERALAIREKALGPDHPEVANSLNNLAVLHAKLGHPADALPLYQRALAIRERSLGAQHPDTATSVSNLAQAYRRMGQYDQALALAERALAIREKVLGPDHPKVAASLDHLAMLKWKQGAADEARVLLLRALPIAARGDQPETLWGVQAGLRRTLETLGQREEAIYWGKSAVNTIQSMRATLRDMDAETQQSFLEDKRGTYKNLASLLIDAGRLAEAEQVLAMLKDHEFTELLHRGEEARPQVDLVGSERAVGEQYAKMVDEAVGRARELDALERRAAHAALSPEDEARRQNLHEHATVWRAEFQKWLASMQASLAAGVSPTDRTAISIDRRQIARESTTLQALVRSDPGAVGLYYVVTGEHLSVIIATARGSFGRRIGEIRAGDLNRRVEALRQALGDPTANPRPAAAALYRTLIGPIAEDLDRAQARTLVLSLTDNLRYVPFAALYDGERYLVERYAIAQIASGANQHADAGRSAWQVAALGMTRAADPLPALPGVRAELESIVRVDGRTNGVLPGTIALDDEFDRRRLEAALRGEHRVVHIGSHFVFTPGSEDASFLLLGDGNHLTLDQIATLDFTGVDQLTLSACQTAEGGGSDDSGAEVEGLATIVARQGAGSVLASLWSVSDASTALLMRGFYEGRSGASALTRAQALRQAQLALLRGKETGKPESARPYAHPYYWAPFVLMGNWL